MEHAARLFSLMVVFLFLPWASVSTVTMHKGTLGDSSPGSISSHSLSQEGTGLRAQLSILPAFHSLTSPPPWSRLLSPGDDSCPADSTQPISCSPLQLEELPSHLFIETGKHKVLNLIGTKECPEENSLPTSFPSFPLGGGRVYADAICRYICFPGVVHKP